jgi:hypothetical protein
LKDSLSLIVAGATVILQIQNLYPMLQAVGKRGFYLRRSLWEDRTAGDY